MLRRKEKKGKKKKHKKTITITIKVFLFYSCLIGTLANGKTVSHEYVSEGNGVNPVFEFLINQRPGERSATVDYIKRNLLVNEVSGHTIHTLPTTMNPLVDFITHFFQDYGALRMGDPNTLEGFTE